MKNLTLKFNLLIIMLLISSSSFAQTNLQGKVVDQSDDSPLPGVNVYVKGTNEGAMTDFDGKFEFTSTKKIPLTLVVSYIGYEKKEISVNSLSDIKTITLKQGVALDEVIISASKKPEKVQESPAAISIIKSAAIVSDQGSSPIAVLRNAAGIEVAQYGVSEGKINLRGRSAPFESETFVIADYRNVVMPSFGTVQYGQMPIPAIDLDRIEVVKGPAGALYGPGVEAGVVHFISKSAWKEQGTTIQFGLGNQSQLQASLRHAGLSKDEKFGYKFTVSYRKAEDFPLDPNNPAHAKRLAGYKNQILSSLTGQPVDLPINSYEQLSISANADLEYKFNGNTSLTSVFGYNYNEQPFRSGQGEGYAKLPRPFAQLRFQSGGFFAQAFWSKQFGGDGTATLYGAGNTLIQEIDQIEGQMQYDFNISDQLSATSGLDYRYNNINTEGTIHGRYEDADTYKIVGGYTQLKWQPTDKIDIFAAGRYDHFNVLDKGSFSPRLGLVFKASDDHTFRTTWNKSFGMPSALNFFADFANTETPFFDVWLNGGGQPLTYNDGNAYSFVTNSSLPSINLPMAVAYGAATQGLAGAGVFGPGGPLQGLQPYMNALLQNGLVTGQVTGSYVDGPIPTPTNPIERKTSLKLSESQMFELGYKGRLSDKLSATVDVYYNKRKNMVSQGLFTNPFIGYANAGSEVANAVAAAIASEGNSLGLVDAQIAGIAGAYAQAIQTNTLNADGSTAYLGYLVSDQSANGKTIDLTYFNVEEINYFGADIALDYYINDKWSVFSNFSWLSENYFEDTALVGTDRTSDIALNSPDKRFKLGVNYAPEEGFTAKASWRWSDAWKSRAGVYSGDVPAYNILDAGIGYGFKNGIQFNLNVNNILDVDYQAIANAAYVNRVILGTITYKLN